MNERNNAKKKKQCKRNRVRSKVKKWGKKKWSVNIAKTK